MQKHIAKIYCENILRKYIAKIYYENILQKYIAKIYITALYIFYLNIRIFVLSAHFYQNIIKKSRKKTIRHAAQG